MTAAAFRIYGVLDSNAARMHHPEEHDRLYVNRDGALVTVTETEAGCHIDVLPTRKPTAYESYDYAVVMPYTNVNDTVGKTPIYVDDIVELRIHSPAEMLTDHTGAPLKEIPAFDKTVTGIVAMQHGAYVVGDYLLWGLSQMDFHYSLRVLGNIHEHPQIVPL